MQGYYDEYGNWIEGPTVPGQDGFDAGSGGYPQPSPTWQQDAKNEAYNPFAGPAASSGATKPTRRLGPNERPTGPSGAVWNDDWWDGQSDYLGGWLIPDGAGFGGAGGSGGGGGDYGGYQLPQRSSLAGLNYPDLNLPRFQAPPGFSYGDFSYEGFQAPTLEEAQNEPGFDYALKQGVKAFENSKAYTGTYKGGATIKGINDYARNMANQNYGQVFDRKGQTYDRNRGNAFGNWQANRSNAAENYMTNYGVSRDTFDRNYGAVKDEYAPKARASELNFARDWDIFAYEGDDAYRRWKAKIEAEST